MNSTQSSYIETVVLGASNEGIKLAKELNKLNKNYIIISNSDKNKDEVEKLNYAKINIKFIDYKRELIILTHDDGLICCNKLVIATGSKHNKHSVLSNESTYYRLDDIKTKYKNDAGIVVGNGDIAARALIKLSSISRYVYLCCSTLFECSSKLYEKIKKLQNVFVLSNTNVIKYKNVSENNKIMRVQLDTYDSISCAYALVLDKLNPNVPNISHNLISKDNDGKIEVDKHCTTKYIRTIYAIGECCNESSKNDWKKLLNIL